MAGAGEHHRGADRVPADVAGTIVGRRGADRLADGRVVDRRSRHGGAHTGRHDSDLHHQVHATVDGRNGHVSSSDGIIDLAVLMPKELGGVGGATNPRDSRRRIQALQPGTPSGRRRSAARGVRHPGRLDRFRLTDLAAPPWTSISGAVGGVRPAGNDAIDTEIVAVSTVVCRCISARARPPRTWRTTSLVMNRSHATKSSTRKSRRLSFAECSFPGRTLSRPLEVGDQTVWCAGQGATGPGTPALVGALYSTSTRTTATSASTATTKRVHRASAVPTRPR